MIGQSLYYLNNKKYITNTTNFSTVIGELNSFYHNKDPRQIIIVHPNIEDTQLVPGQFTSTAEELRAGSSALISFAQWNEVSNIEFIENTDKCILVFTDESHMLNVYSRYIAGLLHSCGFYSAPEYDVDAIACEFIEAIVQADVLLTLMNESDILKDSKNYCASILSNPETSRFNSTYQNGKNFSYDLLFFLNDNYPCADVRSMLIEKFTIHSGEIAKDAIEQFTAQRRDLAYILAVIDWMNANATPENNYATDKAQFIKDVYMTAANSGNYQAAFYALNDLWNKVKDNPDFIAAHTSRANTINGWEYNDQYNEINHLFPALKKVLERNWDINNLSEELKLLDTDVQFFAKRQNRIPYLIHKYTL